MVTDWLVYFRSVSLQTVGVAGLTVVRNLNLDFLVVFAIQVKAAALGPDTTTPLRVSLHACIGRE